MSNSAVDRRVLWNQLPESVKYYGPWLQVQALLAGVAGAAEEYKSVRAAHERLDRLLAAANLVAHGEHRTAARRPQPPPGARTTARHRGARPASGMLIEGGEEAGEEAG